MVGTESADRLIDALESLRQALRSGDFDRMEKISALLETSFSDLAHAERGQVQRLRRLLHENDICLAAAAEGIRSGRRRLREIAAARQGETYDQQGQRQGLGTGGDKGTGALGRL